MTQLASSRICVKGATILNQSQATNNFIFDNQLGSFMADSILMFGVTAGIFAFLVAILFGSRAARKRHASDKDHGESESHSHSSSGSGKEGKRIKKFKSDGTPANE